MAMTTQKSKLAEKLTNGVKTQNGSNGNSIKGSFYEKNKHLIGSLSADVPDLSSNKEHLKGFGRSKNAGNS